MLRLLFASLESLFGAALAGVAWWVHAIGVVVLGLALARPLWRAWVDWRTARAGLVQRWVVDCQNCGQTSPVWAGHCSACGTVLGVPWYVRWRTRGVAWLASPAAARASRVYHALGALLFIGAAAWVVTGVAALSPRGSLNRLFLGLGLLALAAAGRSFGRGLSLERRGVLSRAGDLLQGTAAVGVMATVLFLASAARPIGEARLTTLVAGEAGVTLDDGRRLPLGPDAEVGVEYLQLTHEALGYADVMPIAYLGSGRLSVDRPAPARWLIAHLRAHPDTYERRGLTVRVRRDVRRVAPGERYEVVETTGQLLIRRAPPAARP